MKNIKFRGKRVDNGEWVYGSLVVLDYHNSFDYIDAHQIVLPNGHVFEVIPETVGQSTGLFDKNGVEIYKDDILHHNYFKEVAKVIWHYNQSRWALEYNDKKTQELFPVDKKSFKVIGNIHENSELLK